MPKRIEYESNIKEYGDDYIIYKDNSKYEGTIMKNENGDDRRHGYGLMTYSDGRIYEGDYKNNLKEGNGKLTFADGLIYEGEFKNNKNEGYLKAYDKYGKIVFDGTINEKCEATGFMIHTDSNGSLYEGYVVNNLKEGKGIFTFANGNIYEGEFKDDMRHGKGTLYCKEIYDDGEVYEEIYEGYWENDMKNGKGETRIKGYWRDNYVVSDNENIRYNRIVEEIKSQLEKNCRCSYYNNSDPRYQDMFPDGEVYTFY
jgi:hypothetical protein